MFKRIIFLICVLSLFLGGANARAGEMINRQYPNARVDYTGINFLDRTDNEDSFGSNVGWVQLGANGATKGVISYFQNAGNGKIKFRVNSFVIADTSGNSLFSMTGDTAFWKNISCTNAHVSGELAVDGSGRLGDNSVDVWNINGTASFNAPVTTAGSYTSINGIVTRSASGATFIAGDSNSISTMNTYFSWLFDNPHAIRKGSGIVSRQVVILSDSSADQVRRTMFQVDRGVNGTDGQNVQWQVFQSGDWWFDKVLYVRNDLYWGAGGADTATFYIRGETVIVPSGDTTGFDLRNASAFLLPAGVITTGNILNKTISGWDIADTDFGIFTFLNGQATMDDSSVESADVKNSQIYPYHLASVDFGSMTYNPAGGMELDNGTVGAAMLADDIFGDFTVLGGVVSLNNDVVDTTNIADGNHSAFSYSGGNATLNAGSVNSDKVVDESLTAADCNDTMTERVYAWHDSQVDNNDNGNTYIFFIADKPCTITWAKFITISDTDLSSDDTGCNGDSYGFYISGLIESYRIIYSSDITDTDDTWRKNWATDKSAEPLVLNGVVTLSAGEAVGITWVGLQGGAPSIKNVCVEVAVDIKKE